jgi:hypothetical protein
MATKGRTTPTADSAISIENRTAGRQETFVAGDEITSISAYTEVTTADKNIQAALYDMAGGDNNRLAIGTAQLNTQALGWVTIPISYTVSSVTDILIAVCIEGGGGIGELRTTASVTEVTSYHDAAAAIGYPPPATWSGNGWGSDTNSDLCLYATYTEAGGGFNASLAAHHLRSLRR